MNYRIMGKSGVEISALSMGCGHLPDDDEACNQVLRAAVAAGVNYFETAVCYCNGLCQDKTGRGLEPVRDQVMISAKHGMLLEGEAAGHPATTADSYRREIIENQLPRLRTDHVEWLQMGWFTANKIDAFRQKGGVLEAMHRLQDEKIAGHLGFTSHDTPENVIKIIKTGLFSSCTVQYNLLNRAYEPALDAAGEHGVAVVVMGPLHGGLLGQPEPALREMVPNPEISTARACLQFVLKHPAVATACSGMTTTAQLQENISGILDPANPREKKEMQEIFRRFTAVAKTLCTGCNYCKPCPAGVDISRNLRIRNYLAVYGAIAAARNTYMGIDAGQRADCCNQCGDCEKKCPNQLPVRELLKEIAAACG